MAVFNVLLTRSVALVNKWCAVVSLLLQCLNHLAEQCTYKGSSSIRNKVLRSPMICKKVGLEFSHSSLCTGLPNNICLQRLTEMAIKDQNVLVTCCFTQKWKPAYSQGSFACIGTIKPTGFYWDGLISWQTV